MGCGQAEASPGGCPAGPAALDAHLAVETTAVEVQEGPGPARGASMSAHSRRVRAPQVGPAGDSCREWGLEPGGLSAAAGRAQLEVPGAGWGQSLPAQGVGSRAVGSPASPLGLASTSQHTQLRKQQHPPFPALSSSKSVLKILNVLEAKLQESIFSTMRLG